MSVKSARYILLPLGMVSGACAEMKMHVAAGAAAGGDGGSSAPYQTLAQARDAIRAARWWFDDYGMAWPS